MGQYGLRGCIAEHDKHRVWYQRPRDLDSKLKIRILTSITNCLELVAQDPVNNAGGCAFLNVVSHRNEFDLGLDKVLGRP